MPRVEFIEFKVKNYCQPQTLRQKITRTQKNPQKKASDAPAILAPKKP
jgi:hypothetical protein